MAPRRIELGEESRGKLVEAAKKFQRENTYFGLKRETQSDVRPDGPLGPLPQAIALDVYKITQATDIFNDFNSNDSATLIAW